MVDHIHFPKRVAPLFPAEKIRKVRRKKDNQQSDAFKEKLEKEKKTSDDQDEDGHEPDQSKKRAVVAGGPGRVDSDPGHEPSKNSRSADEKAPTEKIIDVHA